METATFGQTSEYLYCSIWPNCESRLSEVMYNISEFHWISTLYNLKYWQPPNVNRTQNNWPNMRKLHDDGVSLLTTLSVKRMFCKNWVPEFWNEAHLLIASPSDLLVSSNGKLSWGREAESLKCICSHYERTFGWFSSTFPGVAEGAYSVIAVRKTTVAISQSPCINAIVIFVLWWPVWWSLNKNGRIKDFKKGFERKLLHHKTSGKTKKQMGGYGPVGCITTVGDKRMEEKSWK